MALIDEGPDRVEWFAEVETVDSYGTPVRRPSATATDVFTAHVQRANAGEAIELGQTVEELYTFNTRRRLFGADSALRVNGKACEVLAPPTWQGRTDRTAHTRVRFRFSGVK